MPKSKTAYLNKKLNQSVELFQSAAMNRSMFNMYKQWIESLAVNRFKWINLPPTCDERYLETTLFYNGVATIAHPKDAPALVYSTQAAPSQVPNVYDNPTIWQSIGANGWQFDVTNENGVIIYDNRLRLPMADHCEVFARRLTEIDRTLDINMLQQRTPFLVTGPQEKEFDIANVLKQIAGGEVAIAGYDNLVNSVKIEAVQTGVQCIASDIGVAKTQIWNDIYRFLGFSTVSNKPERMVAEEASTQVQQSEIMALDPLNARREACAAWNLMHPDDPPIDVVWATDWKSDSYNYANNMMLREGVVLNA